MTTRRITDVTLTDTTGAKQIRTATNYATNPRAALGTTNWSGATSAGTGGTWDAGTSVPTGGPSSDCPSFFRKTITAAPSGGTMQLSALGAGITIDVGDIGSSFTMTMFARSSESVTGVTFDLQWYNGSTFLSSIPSAAVNLVAGVWLPLPAVTGIAPATATRIQPRLNFPVSGVSGGVAIGDTFDATGLLPIKTIPGLTVDYFDGSVAGGSWAGTVHASRSSKVVGIA